MADAGVVVVKGDQIIIFAVPCEGVGARHIPGAVPPVMPVFVHVQLKVAESDLLPLGDPAMYLIYIIIDALVHGFDPACHIDLPLQAARLMDAAQPLDLSDQGGGFFMGDEF